MNNITKLKKIENVKTYHGDIVHKDEYAYVDQPHNILEVLKDPTKVIPEVRKYIDENNVRTESYFKDVEDLQKKLFFEIKGKIKLDDTSLKFKDKKYYYWTKTEKKGDYGKRVRQLINGTKPEEVFWDGDLEKKRLKAEFFSTGSTSVSHCDNYLAYSLDLQGSEYYTIYLRNLDTGKELSDIIPNTSGSIAWSLDSKSFFYSKLDKYHRPRTIYKHTLGQNIKDDQLIFEEKEDDSFTCSIGLSADEKYFVISTGNHMTYEEHFFPSNEKNPKPILFQKRKNEIRYAIDFWKDGYIYIHTNEDAEDYKILRCKVNSLEKKEEYIPAKKGTIIGGLEFLDKYILRGEKSNAISKLYVRNIKTNNEEEIKVSEDEIGCIGMSLIQKATDTTKIRVSWESMKTPDQIFEYDIEKKSKKLVKETQIPSGHDPKKYIVERLMAKSHDGANVPISLVRRKDTKLDGKNKLVLYFYGAYGASIDPGWGSSKFCLIDRGFIYAIAHVRGGKELGEAHHTEAIRLKKKNTFHDVIAVCNHLINNKYTFKGGICTISGSAGGTTGGAVANMAPDLFFSMLLLVPFFDVLTTMCNRSLPLTPSEEPLWSSPLENKENFEYIKSYSPYENIRTDVAYPNMFITSSLFDTRVLYSEAVKYFARLQDRTVDKNIHLLKCRTEPSSHGGLSGRDNAIKELAEEFSFILKTAGILN